MAITLVRSFAGSASNNGTTPSIGASADDLVIIVCAGGRRSTNIPDSTADAPSQTSGTSPTEATFTLLGASNTQPGRLSFWYRYWTGTNTAVHLGSGWGGNGNHYSLIVLRGAAKANGSIVLGSFAVNENGNVTEPSVPSGWTQFAYVGGWSTERGGTFNSPTPTGFAIASQSNGSEGSVCTTYDLDLTSAVTNISIGGGGGRDIRSNAVVVNAGTTTNDEVRDVTDTATVADSVVSEASRVAGRSDTFSAEDSRLTQASLAKSESTSAIDTCLTSIAYSVSRSATASDSVSTASGLERSESVSVADTVDTDATTGISETESATAQDSSSLATELLRSRSAVVLDSADANSGIARTISSTASDSLSFEVSFARFESATVVDDADSTRAESVSISSTVTDEVDISVSVIKLDSFVVADDVDPATGDSSVSAAVVVDNVNTSSGLSRTDSVSVAVSVDVDLGTIVSESSASAVEDSVVTLPALLKSEATSFDEAADVAFALKPDAAQVADGADVNFGLSLVEPSGVTGEIDLIPGFAKEESSSANDSVDVGPAYLISESSQVTDAVDITLSLTGKDSSTIGDDVDLGFGYQSPAVVDDTVLVTPVISVGETAVINDSVVTDEQGNYTRDPQADATVSDNVDLSHFFVVSDGATVGDEVSVEIGVPRLETSVVADDVDFEYPKLLDDSTVVIGDASQEIGFARLETSIVADDVEFDYPKLIGDSITVGDEVSIQIGFARLETSLVADDLSLGYPRLISDDTEVVGDVGISIGYALLEEINVVPTVDTDEEGVYRLESNATVGDDVSIQIGFARLETSLVADDLELGYPRLIADDSIVTDSVSVSAGYVLVQEIDVVPTVDVDQEGVARPAVSIEADDNLALSITQESVDPAVIADDVDATVTTGTTDYVENLSDALSFEDIIEGIPRLIPQDEVFVIPGVGTDIDMGPDDYWEIEDDAIIFVRTGGDDSSTVDPTVILGFDPSCGAVVQTVTVQNLDKLSSSSGTVSDSVELDIDLDLDIFPEDEGNVADEVEASTSPQNFLAITIIGRGSVDGNAMTEVQALATLDIWNVALNALGISTLGTTEGDNPQQTLLNNTFPLFRKQFLSDHLWNGAKRTAELTSITVDSDNDAVKERWGYVYRLPSDCMRVWRLNGSENKPNHTGGNPAILTNRWEIEIVMVNGLHERALCTEESSAHIEYVFDVGNNIDLLGPLTQHAMGLSLAAFVATNFGKSASEIAQLDAQAKEAVTAAKGVDGQEGTPQMFGDTSLLRVRSLGN